MTKDPICGMTLDEATALRTERDGQTFYFCSEHCRKKFLSEAAPIKADDGCCGGKSEHADHAIHEHVAEEHSCCSKKASGDVHRQSYRAHSLHGHEHAAITPSAAAKYFCPMCPGVESDKP